MNIENINIDKLVISDINVRKTQINEITELSNSIDINGLINPITVRKINDDKYEIIAGQRRYLAMKELHKHTIPCNIIIANDSKAEEMSLIENLQKNNLSNCDKVKSFSKLYDNYANDYDKIKSLVKVSKATIKKYLRIKDLPIEVLEKLDANDKTKINVPTAIELLPMVDKDIDLIDVIDKLASLKSKNKIAAIKKFNENNSNDINDFDDIIEEINDSEKVDYKGPYVFDSVKQQNILIPENMYSDIINFIKEKIEDKEIIYFS
jgi:ParB family chromosome partitioning protein